MRHQWRPADTDPEAWERLVERWRSMTIEERWELFDRMDRDLTALTIAGIRADLPDVSEQRLRYELIRRRYGEELADEVFGGPPR